ncbi:uncharacterized protein LOC141853609 isoform X1 [Brevipalpus obovatus]|uniref:uncharacterized protein LOC141853609 isoform X1 n=1 Tax=Brevipalpus obovatus TaxID=246614 RepID=UPI003D9EEF79
MMKLLSFICALTIIGSSSAFQVNSDDLRYTCEAFEHSEGNFDHAFSYLQNRLLDRGITAQALAASFIETVARMVINDLPVAVQFVDELRQEITQSESTGNGLSLAVKPIFFFTGPGSFTATILDGTATANTSGTGPASNQSPPPPPPGRMGLRSSKISEWLAHQFPATCSQLSFPSVIDAANSKSLEKLFFNLAIQRQQLGVEFLQEKQANLAP